MTIGPDKGSKELVCYLNAVETVWLCGIKQGIEVNKAAAELENILTITNTVNSTITTRHAKQVTSCVALVDGALAAAAAVSDRTR